MKYCASSASERIEDNVLRRSIILRCQPRITNRACKKVAAFSTSTVFDILAVAIRSPMGCHLSQAHPCRHAWVTLCLLEPQPIGVG